MKRVLCLLLALITVVFCFVGCSKDAENPAPSSAAPGTSAKVPSEEATDNISSTIQYFPLAETVTIDWWCPWTFYESAQVFHHLC